MRTPIRDIGNYALTALTRVKHDPRIAAQAVPPRLSFIPSHLTSRTSYSNGGL